MFDNLDDHLQSQLVELSEQVSRGASLVDCVGELAKLNVSPHTAMKFLLMNFELSLSQAKHTVHSHQGRSCTAEN